MDIIVMRNASDSHGSASAASLVTDGHSCFLLPDASARKGWSSSHIVATDFG